MLKSQILTKPLKRSNVDFRVFLTTDDQNHDLIVLRVVLKIIFSFARGSIVKSVGLKFALSK